MDRDDYSEVRMPFGRWKHSLVMTEVPVGYLRWLVENCEIKSPQLREAIEARLTEDEPLRAWRMMAKDTGKFFNRKDENKNSDKP